MVSVDVSGVDAQWTYVATCGVCALVLAHGLIWDAAADKGDMRAACFQHAAYSASQLDGLRLFKPIQDPPHSGPTHALGMRQATMLQQQQCCSS